MAMPTRCPRCGATLLPPPEALGGSSGSWECPNCGATDAMPFDEAGESDRPGELD